MNKNKEKVPKIRFPGFTEPWEQRKLGEVIPIVTDYVAAGSFADIANNVSYISEPDYAQLVRTVDLKHLFDNNGFIYVDKNAFEYLYRVNLDEECIVLPNIGANIGEVYYIEPSMLPYENNVLGPNAILLKPVEQTKFLYTLFQTLDFQKKLSIIVASSGQPKFNKTELKEINFVLPSREEQEKIGEYFKHLDNLITLHQRKLNHLKDKKKGLLQKMFPKNGELVPELRFPEFTDPWEQRKLGEVSEKVTEKNKNNIYSETLTNSAEYGIINQRDFFDKDISNEKNLDGYYIVRPDDFVYNPRISNYAPVGPINRNNLGRSGVMSPLYYVFRTHSVDKIFLEKYFSSNNWHKFMKLNGDSGARADRFAIKDSVFREMPIPSPAIEEQTKIGEFFQGIDNLITLHQRKLDHLKEQKKALLQQMFI
ncbi:restriction endonuclease subunit S [Clostridium butyricum]|uniref:restriction endonuclease subunit S n=1 Tax=Clostridium butyricum TaxID=1492 RepID=UPI00051B7C40|nr:restriction endonuclease subunit S [Clostridium butyricum]QUF84851.1 restriction endonuclease subunit S [Clostridium butyricum]